MKPCIVTLPFPILKSKGKYCMAEKQSHVERVSLSHLVEINGNNVKLSIFGQCLTILRLAKKFPPNTATHPVHCKENN